MTESVHPIPPDTEEALCLYVLDMLPEDERAAMEARLAAEPALRRSARELQETLDGCVQSVPQRLAPLRVWGRIAATISSAEAPVFATDSTQVERPGSLGWYRNRNLGWGWQALGAAACFAAGIGLHAMWSSLRQDSVAARSALVAGKTDSFTPRPNGSVVASPQPGSHGAEHVTASESTATGKSGTGSANTLAASATDSGHAASAAANRPQERALQTQVAVLTELLNRELGTPPGTARLQVVRLVGPGESAETTATTAVHPDTLAALALTLLNPPGTRAFTTTTSGSTSTVGTQTGGNGTTASNPTAAETAATDSADTLGTSGALATPVVQVKLTDAATHEATARTAAPSEKSTFVAGTTPVSQTSASSPTQSSASVTGGLAASAQASAASGPSGVLLMLPNEAAGTAVISNPTPLSAAEVYQFWQTDPKTGQAVNLGTARSDASTAIFNFSMTSGTTGVSSVFITREPTGGSATPTGPVVVSTPAPKP